MKYVCIIEGMNPYFGVARLTTDAIDMEISFHDKALGKAIEAAENLTEDHHIDFTNLQRLKSIRVTLNKVIADMENKAE